MPGERNNAVPVSRVSSTNQVPRFKILRSSDLSPLAQGNGTSQPDVIVVEADPQAWSDNPSYTATTSSLSSDKQVLRVSVRSAKRKARPNVAPKLELTERIQAIDFSFLDNKNICCGLCGEIIPYDQLIDDHLPKNHPNVFRGDTSTVRAVPFEQWQKKLQAEQRDMETGFKMMAYKEAARAPKPPAPNRRPRRNISLIRVNPRDMTIEQLDVALRRKMFEKLGRHVPVALVDKIHARCGLCNAIISLNKKFEIIHLVRHFNCWHPTLHRCAGAWSSRSPSRPDLKLLTLHDFAVVDAGDDTGENLQCIWCGTFIDSQCLAQHFGDMHSDNVEIPKCNLCLQELILNARFQEKYAVDFAITLPDEHHIECGLCGSSFSTDAAIEAHIRRRHISGISPDSDLNYFSEAEEVDSYDEVGPEAFANSRMILGKRRRPKRQFIMPIMRQAAPLNSQYVEPIAESHWKCKLCDGDIFGAVISAAAIKHYKLNHLLQLDHLQYELCCARLDRVSDGCMEFLHPRLIECLLCEQTFSLHQAFNMCRAIRHLKAKHPNLMPEYAGLQREDSGGAAYGQDDPYYTEQYADPGQVYFTGIPRDASILNDMDGIIDGMDIEEPSDGCQTINFDPNQLAIKGVPFHSVNHMASSVENPDTPSVFYLMSEEQAKAGGYISEDTLLLTPDIQLPGASQIHILGN